MTLDAMGNAPSSTRPKRKKTQTVWDWELRNGRLQPKPRSVAKAPRPLFKPRPNNNYDWWIFNPNTPNKKS